MASGAFSRSRRAPAFLAWTPGLGALSILLILLAGCGHLVFADGPYHGRVLDAETNQPIGGAAVLAVWWKRSPGPGEPIISFYDAQEVVTDGDGNFTIAGISGGSLNPLARIDKPLFTIFKPEYEAYGDLRLAPPTKGGPALVVLRRLTVREERLRNLDKIPASLLCEPHDTSALCIPRGKASILLRLRNIEMRNLGLLST